MRGGPGRTRTSNQTVMSGGTRVSGVDFPQDLTHSIVFVTSRCDRFWCETGAVIFRGAFDCETARRYHLPAATRPSPGAAPDPGQRRPLPTGPIRITDLP